MPEVERSAYFEMSPRELQMYLSTTATTGEWLVGFSPGAMPLPDGPAVLGTTFDCIFSMAGVSFDVTITYVEHEEGVYDVLLTEGGVSSRHTWRYQPEGSGTRVTATIEYEVPGSALGRIADRLIIERLNSRNLEQSLENAKTILDA
jgi:hypothetical protein